MQTQTSQNMNNPKGLSRQVAPGVYCLPEMIVNICLINDPDTNDTEWTLVDTGMANSAEHIVQAARQIFGQNSRLKAIILTHGHFDHIGSILEITSHWDVPVFAHELEMPYLTGQRDYPPPDPSVGGGLMSILSPVYPHNSINLGDRVKALPSDGSIPSMPGWRWIHTPGHCLGHISLFRESDRVLIAGDAFTTVKQESALAVLTQRREVHGPPAYFTIDWESAWESVRKLAALNPSLAISSHGQPMEGEQLANELHALAQNFDHTAIPRHGRYVH